MIGPMPGQALCMLTWPPHGIMPADTTRPSSRAVRGVPLGIPKSIPLCSWGVVGLHVKSCQIGASYQTVGMAVCFRARARAGRLLDDQGRIDRFDGGDDQAGAGRQMIGIDDAP